MSSKICPRMRSSFFMKYIKNIPKTNHRKCFLMSNFTSYFTCFQIKRIFLEINKFLMLLETFNPILIGNLKVLQYLHSIYTISSKFYEWFYENKCPWLLKFYIIFYHDRTICLLIYNIQLFVVIIKDICILKGNMFILIAVILE